MSEVEQWVIVGEFPDYEISNLGRIRNVKNGKMLKFGTHASGYPICRLGGRKNNKLFLLHRLLAISFIENANNKTQINHKNGIKSDCRLSNLEWCTPSENLKHAYSTGLKKVSDLSMQKLLERRCKPLIDIKTNVTYKSTVEAADALGLKRTTLTAMLTGQNINKTSIRYKNDSTI